MNLSQGSAVNIGIAACESLRGGMLRWN
jgi:hypothetical protein